MQCRFYELLTVGEVFLKFFSLGNAVPVALLEAGLART